MDVSGFSASLRLQRLGQSSHSGRLRPAHAMSNSPATSATVSLPFATHFATSPARNGSGLSVGMAAPQRRSPVQPIAPISNLCASAGRKSSATCSTISLRITTRTFSASSLSRRSQGRPISQPLWQCLQHVANHSTYHRGQVTTMLRQLGRQGRQHDLIAFYREMNARQPVGTETCALRIVLPGNLLLNAR